MALSNSSSNLLSLTRRIYAMAQKTITDFLLSGAAKTMTAVLGRTNLLFCAAANSYAIFCA